MAEQDGAAPSLPDTLKAIKKMAPGILVKLMARKRQRVGGTAQGEAVLAEANKRRKGQVDLRSVCIVASSLARRTRARVQLTFALTPPVVLQLRQELPQELHARLHTP